MLTAGSELLWDYGKTYMPVFDDSWFQQECCSIKGSIPKPIPWVKESHEICRELCPIKPSSWNEIFPKVSKGQKPKERIYALSKEVMEAMKREFEEGVTQDIMLVMPRCDDDSDSSEDSDSEDS
ncbi:hypothetical protein L1887_57644 [Cichorium endivia]|nr:hypothetical protein L1887_57644 [Cichorium endivia]